MSRGFLRSLKKPLAPVKHWIKVLRGAWAFRRTGVTPEEAYQSMISLHCKSSGRAIDMMHAAIASRAKKCPLPEAEGVLGSLSNQEVARLAGDIRRHGYCVFPRRAPEEVCAALEQFARTRPAKVSPPAPGAPVFSLYSPTNPRGDVYRFDEQTLLDSPDIQRILADYSLLGVAQEYLGCPPIIDIVAMWWSAVNHGADQVRRNAAAQAFHFDMDRVKWLKVFVYLTDVDATGGPHCLVAGTHRAGAVPLALLERGYARIEDRELGEHFAVERVKELTGPRGTVLAVDTRALHKGKPPQSHDRLIVQLSYCDSLFGGAYNRPSLPAECVSELREALERFPVLYQRFGRASAAPVPRERAA